MLMGVIGFLIPRTGLLSAQSLNILHVVCVGAFWCMFIHVCLSVLVPVMHYFCTLCVCVWERCSGDSEQRGLRESLLTGSDGKLWNGNKASCHYSTNSLSRTRWYTARQQWLQTNEQITSPSSPSLADWTQIVMRDMRSEQRIVLNAYKYRCH